MPTTLAKRRLHIWDQKVLTAQSFGVQLDDATEIAPKLGPMYTSGWFSGGAITSGSANTVSVASAVLCFDERLFTSPACNAVPFPNANAVVYKLGLCLGLRPTVIELNEYVGGLGYRYEEWIMGACTFATGVHIQASTIHLVLTDLLTFGGGTPISWAGRTVRAQLVTPLSETDWYEDLTVQYGNVGSFTNVNYITLSGVLGQTDSPSDQGSYYLVSFEGLAVMANDSSPGETEMTLLGTVTGNGGTPASFSTTGRTTLYFPSGVAGDLAAHIADHTDPHTPDVSFSGSVTTPVLSSVTGILTVRVTTGAAVDGVVNFVNATSNQGVDIYTDGRFVFLNQDQRTADCGLVVRRLGGETSPNAQPALLYSHSADRWKLVHFTNGVSGWVQSRKTATKHIWRCEALLADPADPPEIDSAGGLMAYKFLAGEDCFVQCKLGPFPKDFPYDTTGNSYIIKAIFTGTTPGSGESIRIAADLALLGPSFGAISLDSNAANVPNLPASDGDVIPFSLTKALDFPSNTYYTAYIRFGREGSDVLDTYSGDVLLTDVWLEYTPTDLY